MTSSTYAGKWRHRHGLLWPSYVSERAKPAPPRDTNARNAKRFYPDGSVQLEEAMLAWREAHASFHEATERCR